METQSWVLVLSMRIPSSSLNSYPCLESSSLAVLQGSSLISFPNQAGYPTSPLHRMQGELCHVTQGDSRTAGFLSD